MNSHWQHKPHKWKSRPKHWRHRPPMLFMSFVFLFGLMTVLVLGGMGLAALLLTRLAGGTEQTAMAVWLVGCGLVMLFPIFAGILARQAFRGIALPLSDVMRAADAVADGDLSARVTVAQERGGFTPLAHSFNRMATELEGADARRRQLTADVAHELRTPLHIIRGNLEGVLDGVYEPTEEHILATLDETRQLARLVDDLRTLSLAEAGELPLQMEVVDVAELLTDVGTSFSGQAENAGISLTTNTTHLPLKTTTLGDAGRLDQVLSNLIVNALRHTPAEGKIDITASIADDQLQIQVSDTGEGIAEADLPHIFDRFWRGDKARTHQVGTGGGLGLAIVQQLIKSHGGQIEVASVAGQGTVFTILLDRIMPA